MATSMSFSVKTGSNLDLFCMLDKLITTGQPIEITGILRLSLSIFGCLFFISQPGVKPQVFIWKVFPKYSGFLQLSESITKTKSGLKK